MCVLFHRILFKGMFVYSQEIDTINLCHKVITVIRKAFILLPEYLSVGIEMEDPPKALCTNIITGWSI